MNRTVVLLEDDDDDPLTVNDDGLLYADATNPVTPPEEPEEPEPLFLDAWWNGLRATAGGMLRSIQETLAQEMAALYEQDATEELPLPWERLVHGRYQADALLQERMLQLSRDPATFTRASSSFSAPNDYEDYEDDDEHPPFDDFTPERVALIHRLLVLDPHLRAQHAQCAAEGDFWRQYFYACRVVRVAYQKNHPNASTTATTGDARDDVRSASPLSQSAVLDESLLLIHDDDDHSFVRVPSAPNSCLSLRSMKSVGSLVLVDMVPASPLGDAGGE